MADLLLILQLGITWLSSYSLFQRILSFTVPVDECKISETCHPAADDGDFGGSVLRCVLGSEGLWA